MKGQRLKKIFLLAAFSGLFLFSVHSKEINLFSLEKFENFLDDLSFDAGISSGFPVYGDPEIWRLNDEVKNDSGHRVIAGITVDAMYDLTENFTFFAGGDVLFDYIWNDAGKQFIHIDYAVFPGLKVYPFSAGFNLSLAYALCYRTDIYNGTGVFDEAAIGNGFRVGMEYDFARNGNYENLPSIGAWYRYCPRGSNHYDNNFCVCFKIPF